MSEKIEFFCGVRRYVALRTRGQLERRKEPPPMPHNPIARFGSGEVRYAPIRKPSPNWVLSGLPLVRSELADTSRLTAS